jgi:cell division control protein 6
VLAEYELDDRVKSRIGSSEVFFNAYTKRDVLAILKDRAAKAFSEPVDPAVIDYCADQSSLEHGDARRAIDLLRVAGEIAGVKGEKLAKGHVDLAGEKLQKDRVELVLSTASYHLRLACGALAKMTYLSGEVWHSTSSIYESYREIIAKEHKPLTYRRVSELLTEMENTGLVVSHTASKGRHGYGTQYKLVLAPDIIGKAVFVEWWKSVETSKKLQEEIADLKKTIKSRSGIFGSRSRREMFDL